MSGWFLMHRGWMGSADFKPESYSEPQAFIWAIEQAAHSPHLQWFNGVQYAVDRGEFVTSIRAMAAAFKWGLKRTLGFTRRMEKCGKWQRKRTHAGQHGPTILTVCNYALYQAPAKVKKTAAATGAATDGDTARLQPGNSEETQQKEELNNSNERKAKELEASPPRSPALPYQDALAAWSQIAAIKGWKPIKPQLNDKRRRDLGKILQSNGLEGWIAALQRAADSPLLGGPDPPGWFNFAFILRPEKFLNLQEGNYDKSFSGNQQQQSPWLDAHAKLSIQ